MHKTFSTNHFSVQSQSAQQRSHTRLICLEPILFRLVSSYILAELKNSSHTILRRLNNIYFHNIGSDWSDEQGLFHAKLIYKCNVRTHNRPSFTTVCWCQMFFLHSRFVFFFLEWRHSLLFEREEKKNEMILKNTY